MLHSRLLTVLGAGIGVLFLAAAATAQPAAEQGTAPPQSVVVPAGDLGAALDAYIRQTGVQLIYRDEEVIGLQTQGTDGADTHEAALNELLTGTGLTLTRDASGAMAVSDPSRLPASSAAGQNTIGQRRPGIEEIIVTGQKREERIQDVPIAISAFTQEDLTVSQIAGGPDLHLQVPNMTFTKTNFTGYSIQIRGIGTQAISATTDPAVAVALNQTPFIRNRFFEQEFYDMERVEVLRGPQGTLFGRNATAGVVNLITAKPKFQQESMLSYDRGNYDSQRWEAMVNLPLVDDRMALRLAAAGTRRDGYVTNEITDNPIDGRDLWSTRASLRFAPNDNLDINLIWEHFEEDDDRLRSGKQLCSKHVVEKVGDIEVQSFDQKLISAGISADWVAVQPRFSQGCERESLYSRGSFQTPNGASVPYYLPLGAVGINPAFFDPYVSQVQSRDLRVIESTIDPEYRARSDIGQLQIDYQLTDSLLLESETAYSTDEIYSLQDFNRFNTVSGAWDPEPIFAANDGGSVDPVDIGLLDENGAFCDPQLGCASRLVAVDISTAESSQFSQELRLSSQFDGSFNFSLGANYLRYDTVDKYYVFVNSLSYAAIGSMVTRGTTGLSTSNPYVPGVTDNSGCLKLDRLPSNPDSNVGTGQAYGFRCVYVEPNSIDNIQDQGHNYFLSKNPYDLDSYAIFGETYWNVTDALKLTTGLRWSVDKKTAPLIPSWVLAAESIGYPTLTTIEQEWREPTGRLVLDWKPNLDFTDETLVYGSIARGYKGGGANPPPFVPVGVSAESLGGTTPSKTRPRTFKAEFVNAFELGSKNTLADGAVTLNLAAFYYDYKDYQISEIVDRSAFNQNYDAEVWGGEIEADWWVNESLRLGFKGGYQQTRIADGETAVDLMDRTAGGEHFTITDAINPNFDDTTPEEDRLPVSEYVAGFDAPSNQEFFAFEDWVIIRPFPVFPSSCILPAFLYTHGRSGITSIEDVGQGGGSATGGCEFAYASGNDPITNLPYVPNPDTGPGAPGGPGNSITQWGPNYPGWDPSTAPNNGEGFAKDLGGNELPNAPHYTTTFKVDYLVPLRGDWMMTAHTDIYWQSKAWWRIFNDHEYNRLDDYFTMNLAAIFSNEASGWNIMAYIKNVTDETAITGAFLNSDDTGLTTNVFLTEPRLYGIRATKRWDGGGPAEWIGAGTAALLGKEPGEPSPWSLTLGGQMLRPKDSPNEIIAPEFISEFDPNIDPSREQGEELDWGDGREIVLTYAPDNGWRFSLGARFGESNRDERKILKGEKHFGCASSTFECQYYPDPLGGNFYTYRTDYGLSDLVETEEHLLVDFMVGRDVGLGALEGTLSGGLRYAHFESKTEGALYGQPDWVVPEECVYAFGQICPKYAPDAQHHEYAGAGSAEREFTGLGPVVAWDASTRLFDDARGGHLDLDWSLSGGVLFGKQKTSVEGYASGAYFNEPLQQNAADETPVSSYETTFSFERDDDGIEVVPTLGAALGLTYRVGGGSLGFGYSWERYYGVIDGGVEERKSFDRTIDGPYLKVTFGGK